MTIQTHFKIVAMQDIRQGLATLNGQLKLAHIAAHFRTRKKLDDLFIEDPWLKPWFETRRSQILRHPVATRWPFRLTPNPDVLETTMSVTIKQKTDDFRQLMSDTISMLATFCSADQQAVLKTCLICASGSIGRSEISPQSDFEYYVVVAKHTDVRIWHKIARQLRLILVLFQDQHEPFLDQRGLTPDKDMDWVGTLSDFRDRLQHKPEKYHVLYNSARLVGPRKRFPALKRQLADAVVACRGLLQKHLHSYQPYSPAKSTSTNLAHPMEEERKVFSKRLKHNVLRPITLFVKDLYLLFLSNQQPQSRFDLMHSCQTLARLKTLRDHQMISPSRTDQILTILNKALYLRWSIVIPDQAAIKTLDQLESQVADFRTALLCATNPFDWLSDPVLPICSTDLAEPDSPPQQDDDTNTKPGFILHPDRSDISSFLYYPWLTRETKTKPSSVRHTTRSATRAALWDPSLIGNADPSKGYPARITGQGHESDRISQALLRFLEHPSD